MVISSPHLSALVEEWRKLQPLAPENEARWLQKLRLELNYHSNHLEGNTLTYGETELLLKFGEVKGGHTLREYEEMKAHDVALRLVQDWAKEERPLTEAEIRELNRVLLKEPFWKEAVTPNGEASQKQIIPGEYKKLPNSVITVTGEVFEYTAPLDVPQKMAELVTFMREGLGNPEVPLEPFLAHVHHKFLLIHPFDDGNGRVARLLLSYILLKEGLPPLVIRTEEKKNYLSALHSADVGDFSELEKFLAENMQIALKLAIKAARGESLEEPGDAEKELTLLVKELKDKKERVEELISFTPEKFQEIFREQILPITQKLDAKKNILKEFFKDIHCEFNGIKFFEDEYRVDQNILDISLQLIEIIKREPRVNIPFKMVFREFYNNKFHTELVVVISFIFSERYWSINAPLDKNYDKSYNERITAEESQEILDAFHKFLTLEIKKLTGQI